MCSRATLMAMSQALLCLLLLLTAATSFNVVRQRQPRCLTGSSSSSSRSSRRSALFSAATGDKISTTEDDGYSLRHRRPISIRNWFNRNVMRKPPGTLILIRHGESTMNKNGSFTGWIDVDCNDNGIREMQDAGRLLLERGYDIDICYTSRLKRAIRSTWTILTEINQIFRPVYKSWRLNERCYGSLEGKSKAELSAEIGEDRVQEYRKSLSARPPPMTEDHPHWHRKETKYQDLDPEEIPVTESVADCLERTLPLWKNRIMPELISGKTVMVVAHANSLRGLVKHIDSLSEEDLKRVIVPNGAPLIYRFEAKNENGFAIGLKPSRQEDSVEPMTATFLGEAKTLKKKLEMEVKWGEEVPGLEALSQRLLSKESTRSAKSESKSARESEEGTATVSCDLEILSTIVRSPNIVSTLDPADPIVVLIRHGKTNNNKLGIFTGWADAPLAEEGKCEAKKAGLVLKLHGIEFDVVYTSWLSRAIETAWTVLDELDLLWLPIIKSWRLNERMYGVLTGMSKKMIAEKFGQQKFKRWRRGFETQPPPVTSFSPHYPGNDDRYYNNVVDIRFSFFESLVRSLASGRFQLHRKFPKTESLKDCMSRTIPYYTNVIVPKSVAKGERVLIASSENAIRGLLMHLCDIPSDRISEVEIPTGLPLVYSLKKKCIQILDDGESHFDGEDPLSRYHFGTSPELLFRPCDLEGNSDSCFVGSDRSYAYDPIIRLKEKKAE